MAKGRYWPKGFWPKGYWPKGYWPDGDDAVGALDDTGAGWWYFPELRRSLGFDPPLEPEPPTVAPVVGVGHVATPALQVRATLEHEIITEEELLAVVAAAFEFWGADASVDITDDELLAIVAASVNVLWDGDPPRQPAKQANAPRHPAKTGLQQP